MTMRPHVPKETETRLLVQSRRRCCLCFGLSRDLTEKKGQVAHVDHNPANNEDDNLAWLCFDHHDDYDGKTSQSKRFTQEELREHRERLYLALAEMAPEESAQGANLGLGVGRVAGPIILPINQNGDQNTVNIRDVRINERIVHKTEFTPGPQHITEAQAFRIKQIIDELVALDKMSKRPAENGFTLWYGKLKTHFKVVSYRAIPAEQGEEAITWLLQQKAMQRPHLRRQNNDAWRKEYYTAIWARSKQLGLTKEQVYSIATTKFDLGTQLESLKDLGDGDLKRLHSAIFAMPLS